MTMETRLLFSLMFCLFCVTLAAPAVFACRCVPQSLATYYQRADAIAVAKIITVSTGSNSDLIANVEVSDTWKRDIPVQIEVETGTTCIYDLQAGETHLLYLRSASNGRFSTIRCQGNLPLGKSQKALLWLKRHGAKKAVADIGMRTHTDFAADFLGTAFSFQAFDCDN
jgi:hypothetical protein